MPKSRRQKKSGLTSFFQVWKKFRDVSLLALTAAAAVPFVAYLSGITPPWPDGIILITALVELIVLIVVFQFLWKKGRSLVNRVMVTAISLLTIVSISYLSLFSLATYKVPGGETGVKGYVCLKKVPAEVAEQCPFVGDERIADAEYRAELIWSPHAIQITRIILALNWLAGFVFLSMTIGSFVVYQIRARS